MNECIIVVNIFGWRTELVVKEPSQISRKEEELKGVFKVPSVFFHGLIDDIKLQHRKISRSNCWLCFNEMLLKIMSPCIHIECSRANICNEFMYPISNTTPFQSEHLTMCESEISKYQNITKVLINNVKGISYVRYIDFKMHIIIFKWSNNLWDTFLI